MNRIMKELKVNEEELSKWIEECNFYIETITINRFTNDIHINAAYKGISLNHLYISKEGENYFWSFPQVLPWPFMLQGPVFEFCDDRDRHYFALAIKRTLSGIDWMEKYWESRYPDQILNASKKKKE